MTPAFTVTITADNIDQLQASLRELLPDRAADPVMDYINAVDFESLLIKVEERVSAEGYDMEVWKKGERHDRPAMTTTSEKKKEQARAKLRGELVASLAEATHATAAVKNEVEEEFADSVKAVAADPVAVVEELPEATKPKRGRPPKSANGNGATETADALKARIILRLQELYSAGKKAEVNKILAQFGEGAKTFSSIPAEQFPAIAEATEAL